MPTSNKALVSAPTLLKELWPNEAERPSLRWLRSRTKDGTFPFIRLGHLVWFDLDEVREAITATRTVRSKYWQRIVSGL